ncbi:hypothetical protein BGX28_009688 [Mortierella sp. GBA30]|nr:hypothetical protein BGX28_009688 [Mortierella sp. GBA30]
MLVVSDEKLYRKAFYNITMTLGWWSGCMKRATTLRSDQAEAVADYFNKADHILNMTRSFAYRALDLFVKAALNNGDPEGDLNMPLDKSMGRKKKSVEQPNELPYEQQSPGQGRNQSVSRERRGTRGE